MRVSLAAVTVLTNTLPPVVSSNRSKILSLASSTKQAVPWYLETRRVPPRFGAAWRKKLGNQKPRVLKNKETTSESVECDPTALLDVGILACGNTDQYYCMESRNSTLGGVCMEESPVTGRSLFAGGYYVEAAAYYCTTSGDWTNELACNCSTFDNDSRTGSVKCSLTDSYCFKDTSCETCVHLSAEFKIASANSYAIDWCYEFFLPYDQNVCVEYAHQPADTSKCSIEFNGVQCQSCNMLYYDYIDPSSNETLQGTCANFDCFNTEGKHAGNLCEELVSIPTILDQTCDDGVDDVDKNVGNTAKTVKGGTTVSAANSSIRFYSWIVLTLMAIAASAEVGAFQLFDSVLD